VKKLKTGTTKVTEEGSQLTRALARVQLLSPETPLGQLKRVLGTGVTAEVVGKGLEGKTVGELFGAPALSANECIGVYLGRPDLALGASTGLVVSEDRSVVDLETLVEYLRTPGQCGHAFARRRSLSRATPKRWRESWVDLFIPVAYAAGERGDTGALWLAALFGRIEHLVGPWGETEDALIELGMTDGDQARPFRCLASRYGDKPVAELVRTFRAAHEPR
jgi:hypothetical protein